MENTNLLKNSLYSSIKSVAYSIDEYNFIFHQLDRLFFSLLMLFFNSSVHFELETCYIFVEMMFCFVPHFTKPLFLKVKKGQYLKILSSNPFFEDYFDINICVQ